MLAKSHLLGFSKGINFYVMCLSVCLHVCLCVTCVSDAHGDQKKPSDPLEMVIICGSQPPNSGTL